MAGRIHSEPRCFVFVTFWPVQTSLTLKIGYTQQIGWDRSEQCARKPKCDT